MEALSENWNWIEMEMAESGMVIYTFMRRSSLQITWSSKFQVINYIYIFVYLSSCDHVNGNSLYVTF